MQPYLLTGRLEVVRPSPWKETMSESLIGIILIRIRVLRRERLWSYSNKFRSQNSIIIRSTIVSSHLIFKFIMRRYLIC